MRLKEKVKIIEDASMLEELLAYNNIYKKELMALATSDIENNHVPQFPYYRISNEIAPSCKPLLVKQALYIKGGKTMPMGLGSSWHPEAFHLCGELLYLHPGCKFSTDEIFCTLCLHQSQRILLKTHDILQVDIMKYANHWYASLELETKSIAILQKQLNMYQRSLTSEMSNKPACQSVTDQISKKDNEK